MSSPALLDIRGLHHSYGYRLVLDDLDLELRPAEIVCLLGPNGTGKSTLLGALTARNQPDSGTIEFEGRNIHSGDYFRSYLGHVAALHHEVGLLLDLSALQNLRIYFELRTRAAPGDDHLLELLKEVGLGARAHSDVRGFSRGMKQRLALARVFGATAQLLLLDEPTTGLDLAGQRLFLEQLQRARGRGQAVLLTVHDDEPYRDIADRFVFLHGGRIVADITRERFNDQAREHVLGLLYGTT